MPNITKSNPCPMALPEYEIHHGKPYAVIQRRYETGQTEDCPFCDCSHKHSSGDGHRISHCVTIHIRGKEVPPRETFTASDGTVCQRKDGYVLRTVSGAKGEEHPIPKKPTR